jgi:hypothetical protein
LRPWKVSQVDYTIFGRRIELRWGLQMADGARDALGGYLYQFLGAAGLSARRRDLGGKLDIDDQRREVASGKGLIVHEKNDMDVIVKYEGSGHAVGVVRGQGNRCEIRDS